MVLSNFRASDMRPAKEEPVKPTVRKVRKPRAKTSAPAPTVEGPTFTNVGDPVSTDVSASEAADVTPEPHAD